MIKRQFTLQTQLFRVQLGNLQLLIQSASEQEALRAAREQWRVEFPRLWDIISELPDQRFAIERL